MTFYKVKEIIVDTLSCNMEDVTMEATLQGDLGADSLAAVELCMALEEAFSISIDDEVLTTFHTVSDVVLYLNQNARA